MSAALYIVHSNEKGNTVPISLSADDLCLYWSSETGFDTLPYHRRTFAGWLEDGIEDNVIMAAIAETLNAPRPSWVYLQSVISHIRRDQAYTLDAYMARQAAYRQRNSYPSHYRD